MQPTPIQGRRARRRARTRVRRSLLLLGALTAAGCGGASPSIPVSCLEVLEAASPDSLPAGAADTAVATAPAADTTAATAPGADTAAAPPGAATAAATPPAAAALPGDTLELLVRLDEVPPGGGSVRVRVDPLAEPGVVTFTDAPPTAVAAAMALAPPPLFQGCAAAAPTGMELRAPAAPRGRAWVRISSDRPVRVRVVAGATSGGPAVVAPGASATVDWEEGS